MLNPSRTRSLFVVALVTLAIVSPAAARTFEDTINGIFLVGGADLGTDIAGTVIRDLAVRGTDLPSASSNPGFRFMFNDELQLMERETSLGSVFGEQTRTIGRGNIEIGASFLYGVLNEIDGSEVLAATDVDLITDQGNVFNDSVTITDFSLESSFFNFFLTYGLTDRWDVNAVVPLVYSKLDVDWAFAQTEVDPQSEEVVRFQTGRRTPTENAFGVGDVRLRTKYRFRDEGPVTLATVLEVRAPTGEEENFQGLGDWTVTPALVASAPILRHSVYGTIGTEINADALDRSRLRYSVGMSVQVFDWVACLVDIMGSSGFTEQEVDLGGLPAGVARTDVALDVPGASFNRSLTKAELDRTDLIDIAMGFKFDIANVLVAYAGVIVPLTDDGMRAEVLPALRFDVPLK